MPSIIDVQHLTPAEMEAFGITDFARELMPPMSSEELAARVREVAEQLRVPLRLPLRIDSVPGLREILYGSEIDELEDHIDYLYKAYDYTTASEHARELLAVALRDAQRQRGVVVQPEPEPLQILPELEPEPEPVRVTIDPLTPESLQILPKRAPQDEGSFLPWMREMAETYQADGMSPEEAAAKVRQLTDYIARKYPQPEGEGSLLPLGVGGAILLALSLL